MTDRMRGVTRVLVAILVTLAVYVVIAWLASRVDIPAGVPTARLPWFSPFRVVATLGFAIATHTGLSHLAGDFLASILLGGVLGGVFAWSRHLARTHLDG